jgi:hypothetical protein
MESRSEEYLANYVKLDVQVFWIHQQPAYGNITAKRNGFAVSGTSSSGGGNAHAL